MIAAEFADSSAAAATVFAKTDKGRGEVARRSAGLSARQRTVLIMVDGHKPGHALTGLMPAETLAPILDELLALGMIVPVQEEGPQAAAPVPAARVSFAAPSTVPVPAPPSPAAKPAAPPRPVADPERGVIPAPTIDPAAMAQAKAMMIGSAEVCLGLLAAEVVRKVEQANDEEQLLRAVGHWHMAMQASKRGKDIAHAQLESIKSTLRQAVAA